MNNNKKLVSIITPVLEEEENVHVYYEKICEVIDSLSYKYDFEIIITDNASTDKTYDLFAELSKQDKRIRLFSFSRNFGFQNSIYTAYAKARGDCAIEFDCDLQDSPKLLSKFLDKWEEGNKVVYGIRNKRPEGRVITSCRKIYYRLMSYISDHKLAVDAGDFMLVDRVIIDHLTKLNDKNPYLRGIILSFGYKQAGIEYERDARNHGKSKFTFFRLLNLAIDGIISQSTVPLRIASFIGISISVITIITIMIYAILRLFFNLGWPEGFTTTTILILFSICLNAIFLGIIGEYIIRIYNQVRNYPASIIEKEIDNLQEENQ